MLTPEAVFLLKPELYDPRFDGFVICDEAESILGFDCPVLDFDVIKGESIDWKPRKLGKKWRPMPVEGNVRPFNDYPCFELVNPAFSQRAVDALGEMLTDNGEVLPLRTEPGVGDYYAYNLLTKIDALDKRKSIANEFESFGKDTVCVIDHHVFMKTKLSRATIFRIPEAPSYEYVTDRFKSRVESASLNGFDFIQVWPVPEGFDWDLDAAKKRKKSPKVKLVGEALILRFRLEDDNPTEIEERLGTNIEKSLCDLLSVDSLDERYWGSIETSEYVDGEFRIFCTCPSAVELTEYLDDFLNEVYWERDFHLIQRFGNLYDKRAKEKRIAIR